METNLLKKVNNLLDEAQVLISRNITSDKISTIERDLILEKLRMAYDLMVTNQKPDNQVFVSSSAPQAIKVDVDKTPEIPLKAPVPEIKPQVVQQYHEEPKKEKAPAYKEVRREPVLKKVESTEKSIFDGVKEVKPKTQQSSTTDKQPGEIIADKYQGTKKFRNETLSGQTVRKDISSQQQNKPIGDLIKAIGINDKFLFTKELFNGDAGLYNSTVKKLNQFTDITEAMIFIHENFSWKSDNEAANRFIDLVRRKLLNE